MNIIITIDRKALNKYKNDGFNAYIGMATIGVSMCPIGYTEPRYPAADPWFSGNCDKERADEIAGRIIPPPKPFIINAK